MALLSSRWLLPIDRPPIHGGWIDVADGRIRRLGQGAPPGPAEDLGDVAILPGLVNAHTHLELSWMAGHVPPAGSLVDWIRDVLRVRAAGPAGGSAAAREAAFAAARTLRATGTVLVGDVSNELTTPAAIEAAGLAGVVFHELIGFNAADPVLVVREALDRIAAVRLAHPDRLGLTLAPHAPYSVAPGLFAEIARHVPDGPLAVHLAESAEEVEFLRTGTGPFRRLLEDLGVWHGGWQARGEDPVAFLDRVGCLRAGLVAVHGVHLGDAALARLVRLGAIVVACPRSNVWVGAGLPRLSHWYAEGLAVAIGTDSLASSPTLNLFDELAEMRRLAPDVSAACLLESATRVGAEALGFGWDYGTLAPGKVAALTAVEVPPAVTDVEEYLVGGVPIAAIRPLHGPEAS
ncbi:MAG: amidohydrolase family protein [Vicinamibacterales bacterium]